MCDKKGRVPKYKGGRFVRIKSTEDDNNKNIARAKWYDTGARPRDCMSLFFNILAHRLSTVVSLDYRFIMSSNGKNIYLVIKADEKDLAKVAEQEKYNMQMAIGVTDLKSLEPCAKDLTPFRFSKCESANKDSIEKLHSELEEYFEVVEGNHESISDDVEAQLQKALKAQ